MAWSGLVKTPVSGLASAGPGENAATSGGPGRHDVVEQVPHAGAFWTGAQVAPIMTSMKRTDARLVARLHVDFSHVSSAVCMRG